MCEPTEAFEQARRRFTLLLPLVASLISAKWLVVGLSRVQGLLETCVRRYFEKLMIEGLEYSKYDEN
jgi:hypothetical protein